MSQYALQPIPTLESDANMSSLTVTSRVSETPVDTPTTNRWNTLTCRFLTKVWCRPLSVLATLGSPSKDRHQISKPVSNFYILCLLLTQIVYVSSSNSNPSSCSRPKLAVQVIRYQNCLPKRLLNSVCSGMCQSYAKTDPNDPAFIQHSCNCCQIENSSTQRVHLRCPSPDGERRYVQKSLLVRVIRSCACRPCSVLPDIQTGEYL